jgi:hypothetical protein
MLRSLAALAALFISGSPDGYLGHSAVPHRGPMAYADRATETLFYVESDGRHLSAIAFSGKVLWTRNPFVEAHLKPYRVKNPQIVFIGRADPSSLPDGYDKKALFIGISFESTQFGVVDAAKGDFTFQGQD